MKIDFVCFIIVVGNGGVLMVFQGVYCVFSNFKKCIEMDLMNEKYVF